MLDLILSHLVSTICGVLVGALGTLVATRTTLALMQKMIADLTVSVGKLEQLCEQNAKDISALHAKRRTDLAKLEGWARELRAVFGMRVPGSPMVTGEVPRYPGGSRDEDTGERER